MTSRMLPPVQSPLIRATTPLIVDSPEPALVTVPGVELLEVGEDWETSTGVFSFTPEDLKSCIASQDDPAMRTPVVKLGHTDPRFDGQPSLGRIENMRTENNDQTLVGDFIGMPLWLAKVMYSAYPRRSIEGQFDFYTRTGNTWPMVLTGIALLGDAYPAIDTLEDIQALWGSVAPPLYPVEDVEEIAASGSFFRARKVDMPNWLRKVAAATGSGGTVAASVSLDNVRRAYYDEIDATPGTMWWWIREVRINPLTLIVDDDEGHLFEVGVNIDASDTITFGDPTEVKVQYVAAGSPVALHVPGQIVAASHVKPEDTGRKTKPAASTGGATVAPPGSTDTKENDDVLTDEELAALGLEPGATREQISAAILGHATPAAPSTDGNPGSQPETPATDPGAQPAEAPAPGTPAEPPAAPATPPVEEPTPGTAAPAVPEGMALVDSATLAEMQAGIAAAGGLVKRQEKADRDAILDGAIRAGKFGKGRRSHYETLLLSDPIGGKATIAAMEPGLVPVQEVGEGGTIEPGSAEDQTAYPSGWRKSVDAARAGVGSSVKVVQD